MHHCHTALTVRLSLPAYKHAFPVLSLLLPSAYCWSGWNRLTTSATAPLAIYVALLPLIPSPPAFPGAGALVKSDEEVSIGRSSTGGPCAVLTLGVGGGLSASLSSLVLAESGIEPVAGVGGC
jgi:hypothetical protein